MKWHVGILGLLGSNVCACFFGMCSGHAVWDWQLGLWVSNLAVIWALDARK